MIVDYKTLNAELKRLDLGDDFLENKNLLFDPQYTALTDAYFESACFYANNKMAWYWADSNKFYLLADCNRFHFMWLGHFQEWCTIHNIANPAIGRAYGNWEKTPHAWAWVKKEDGLVFVNWGETVDPKTVTYDGKGSVAV